MEQQSTSDCLERKCATINMEKYKNCMPRGSKTMKSNQLLCGRGVPCKDEGLEKGNFLKPYLANYNYILQVLYIKCRRICLACIGYYMLVRVVRILHL